MNITETNTLGSIGFGTATSTLSAVNMPSLKQLQVKEVGETIEIIYKETLNLNYSPTIHLTPFFQERIFKIVYSCVDGKWNKSERIYGEIVPAQEEYYDFDL